MEKVQIFDAQEASKVAKEYLAGMHLNAELVADGHNVVHRLANVYRTPDYRNKVGGVCFVFEYKTSSVLSRKCFISMLNAAAKRPNTASAA